MAIHRCVDAIALCCTLRAFVTELVVEGCKLDLCILITTAQFRITEFYCLFWPCSQTPDTQETKSVVEGTVRRIGIRGNQVLAGSLFLQVCASVIATYLLLNFSSCFLHHFVSSNYSYL